MSYLNKNIKTFRNHNGLWENQAIEHVAIIEGFKRRPTLIYNFYNLRRKQLQKLAIKPNKAHFAISFLEKNLEGSFTLITQNVDNIHGKATEITDSLINIPLKLKDLNLIL